MHFKRKSMRVSAEQWFPHDMQMGIRLGISVYEMPWGGISASISGGTPIYPGDWVVIDDHGKKEVVKQQDFDLYYEPVTDTGSLRCQLISEFACSMEMHGFVLDAVEVPARAFKILQDKGIKVGDYFNWKITNVDVYPEDIQPDMDENKTSAEATKNLYETFKE